MAKKKTETEPAPEPKTITPAPKVVIKVDAAGAEKLERLPSLLGTIHARKQAATANRKAAFEDRDAIETEIDEMGTEARDARTDEYLRRCADLREVLTKIDGLDLTIKQCVNAYDRVASDCEQGTFAFAELTIDELLDEATKKGGGQMTLDQAEGTGRPGVGAAWRQLYRSAMFGGKEWAKAAPFFDRIGELKSGVVPCDTPLVFADYIREQFAGLLESGSRSSLLPKAPEWFRDGLGNLMAAAIRGEFDEEGNEEHEADRTSMCARLSDADDKDSDAFVKLVGGPDSPWNKALIERVAETV